MIQPVIVEVESQREAVRKLVSYCRELDGTRVKVVPLSPALDATFVPENTDREQVKAARAAFSLHTAALAMKGKPFIWLEHDSIPLKAGWAKALSAAYEAACKPFLFSQDSNPPHDLVGGIGVYPPETHWLVPCNFRAWGWDMFVKKQLGDLLATTPLIQHSYGDYSSGLPIPHEFPRDSHKLRPDAVIFHRDPKQSLLLGLKQPERVFYHSGDLGDVIYHLDVIRRLGGGHLRLGSSMGFTFPSHCREPMTPGRVANLAPLALKQPYIRSVKLVEQADPSWTNLNLFREIFKGNSTATCMSLHRAGLRRFGIQPQDDTLPWLSIGVVKQQGYIAVARSPRYHNPDFPWAELVKRYRRRIKFVGLKSEHEDFCAAYGRVAYHPTKDLLAVAAAIAASRVFVGNQSCPYSIAEGLKHPSVLECWPHEPNCLFTRPSVLNMTTNLATITSFIDSYADYD